MKKTLLVLLSLALGAALSLAAESSMKCGAGKCGNAKKVEKKEAKKDSSMKCGAGKCGGNEKKESKGKCGAAHMKTNDGKCG